MRLSRRIPLALYVLCASSIACADASAPANQTGAGALRFVNATANGAAIDIIVGNTVVRTGLTHGDVFDYRLAPSTHKLAVGVRSAGSTKTALLDSVPAHARVLIIAHGIQQALAVLAADTNTARMDRVNVRIAFAAPNAPLVKAYVQPETQSSLGPLPWVSTQSPYVAPLVTTYYRGTPSSQRLVVIFAEYNPGGPEHILAVSPPFAALVTSAWLITFDAAPTGYGAVLSQEPTVIAAD